MVPLFKKGQFCVIKNGSSSVNWGFSIKSYLEFLYITIIICLCVILTNFLSRTPNLRSHEWILYSASNAQEIEAPSFIFFKNVLQFLLISARGRIPCNLVSKYRIHLANLWAGKVTKWIKHFPHHMKLHHCSYISMSFLQHILSSTDIFFYGWGQKFQGNFWPHLILVNKRESRLHLIIYHQEAKRKRPWRDNVGREDCTSNKEDGPGSNLEVKKLPLLKRKW